MDEVVKKFAAKTASPETDVANELTIVPPTQSLGEGLRAYAAALQLDDIEPSQFELLRRYCELVWQWNTQINLTRHTDAETFVKRDLLDTWHLVKHLAAGEQVLDFGSGSGVPGLTAAILRPDLKLTLCDSVQKKARVLQAIVDKLKLPVEVLGVNVKQVLIDRQFTSLTSRAVGSLSKMCTWLQPHWPHVGRLLTIKGPSWVEERGEARHLGHLKNFELRKLVEYSMPDRDSSSVILQLRPSEPVAPINPVEPVAE